MSGLATLLYHYLRARHGYRFRDRAALERWQDARVQAHLARVLPRSPFYREHVGDRPLSAWREFPAIDKAVMMAEFDRLNTVGISREAAFEVAMRAEASRDFAPTIGDVTVGLSSGTSGHRGLFLVRPAERMAWAGAIMARVKPGPLLAPERVAFFLRANSNLYTSVGSRRIRFEFFDLIDDLEAHVRRLNALAPTLLVAPPSMLRFLAEARRSGRLTVAPVRLVSVAEVLDPLDEALIGETFGQTVHQVYQCTEGFLAATCDHGTLHLNEHLVAVQKDYMDLERRKFAPILTDFTRTTQPIVRYRLNDVLTERASPCPCGSVMTALESIEGRQDDVFYLPGPDGALKPVFPDFLRRAVLAASPAIQEYQVVQMGPGELAVALRVEEGARAEAEASVRASLRLMLGELGCGVPAIGFVPYALTPGPVKLRRIERRFQLN